MNPLIRGLSVDVRNLGVSVGPARLLHEIDLDLAPGRTYAIVGPNGSGKSTLLRCLYRALSPTTGQARVEGTDVTTTPLAEHARRVAALAQEESLELDFTVTEVVALGRHPHPVDPPRDRAIVAAAMADTDITHLADRCVLSLSGGERQRVMLARVLTQQAPVVILDEPTNHLDLRHQWDVLARIATSPATVLLALHDLNLASSLADDVILMRAGRIITVGPPEAALTPDLVTQVYGVTAHALPHPGTGRPQFLFSPTTIGATRGATPVPTSSS